MSTRSPQNERNTNPDAKPGYMRKSAASAKPARSAASSVRVVPASSKEKRKQAERGESLAGLSKEEKRARKQAERLQEDRLYAASNALILAAVSSSGCCSQLVSLLSSSCGS